MDWWEYIADRWEHDSMFKEQIVLAVILSAISLTFVIAEVGIRRRAL